MCSIAQEILAWSKLQSVMPPMKLILGKKVLANQLNHPDQILPTEWSVLPRVLDTTCEVLGLPHADLFTTSASMKLPLYASLVCDPLA